MSGLINYLLQQLSNIGIMAIFLKPKANFIIELIDLLLFDHA